MYKAGGNKKSSVFDLIQRQHEDAKGKRGRGEVADLHTFTVKHGRSASQFLPQSPPPLPLNSPYCSGAFSFINTRFSAVERGAGGGTSNSQWQK